MSSRRKVPIDPKLPARFDNTPNDERPASHRRWWDRPYIVTITWEQMRAGFKMTPEDLERRRADWFVCWPSGTRYDVRCLDGGAWDRSSWWAAFMTLEAALAFAGGGGPTWRRGVLEMRRAGQIAGAPPPAPAGSSS